ncbi:MAG TPA: LacI family DNA-binding transcriptional regulator [Gemmatimonadales bacterium]|nr:LacI family DNA-binding transcriptional regulator [Gemmatimonadales bacterium]
MVTIRDVARAAGVSVATASRALHKDHLVAPDTRATVRSAAERLHYTPHRGARSLITSTTHTIGVLLPDHYGEFFSEVIRGLDQTAQAAGYHCLLSSARDGGPTLEAALRSMRGRVDGLVLMSPEFTGDLSKRALPDGFPVVLLNCPPTDAPHDSLTVANYEGAHAMVRHLAGLGHQRIAIIKGAEGNFDAAERLRGYRAALREAGLPFAPELAVSGNFSEAAGDAGARALLRLADRPTAIFAANDGMAIGALHALRDNGLRIPQDISIGGFDDIPMARYIEPALTSVHVDISALGERAAARLFSALERRGDRTFGRETLPTTLVVRRSCGARGI